MVVMITLCEVFLVKNAIGLAGFEPVICRRGNRTDPAGRARRGSGPSYNTARGVPPQVAWRRSPCASVTMAHHFVLPLNGQRCGAVIEHRHSPVTPRICVPSWRGALRKRKTCRRKFRAGGIRTRDLLNPIQAHYQAVLRPGRAEYRMAPCALPMKVSASVARLLCVPRG